MWYNVAGARQKYQYGLDGISAFIIGIVLGVPSERALWENDLCPINLVGTVQTHNIRLFNAPSNINSM